MAKDFGDSVLPVNPPGHFFHGSHLSPIQVTTWDFLTLGLMHLLHTCVAISGSAGWAARMGNVVVVIAPMDSEFRRSWWAGDGEVGMVNGTGLLDSQ